MQKGISIFGKQYEVGYKNDVQADGSVVKVLFSEMIKLENNSAEYLYGSYTDLSNRYKSGSRVFLENTVNGLKGQTDSETIENVTLYCRTIVMNCDTDTEDMIFGGTEEEVIERGTYWCTDIARVACIMFQIAGLPSRIVTTANTKFAYCGHMVAEVHCNNKWGVIDANSGIVFKHRDGTPMSVWEIHNDYNLANQAFYQRHPEAENEGYLFFPPGEQYESVGISNYYVDEKDKYNYQTSRVNDYCREILRHSDEKWARGIRWIHGEDLIS